MMSTISNGRVVGKGGNVLKVSRINKRPHCAPQRAAPETASASRGRIWQFELDEPKSRSYSSLMNPRPGGAVCVVSISAFGCVVRLPEVACMLGAMDGGAVT